VTGSVLPLKQCCWTRFCISYQAVYVSNCLEKESDLENTSISASTLVAAHLFFKWDCVHTLKETRVPVGILARESDVLLSGSEAHVGTIFDPLSSVEAIKYEHF
jgi:hypothetical protein